MEVNSKVMGLLIIGMVAIQFLSMFGHHSGATSNVQEVNKS
jgi:hypothetical protein